MKEPLAQNRSSVVVTDPSGDTDIDQLLRARSEIDSALRRGGSCGLSQNPFVTASASG